MILHQNSNPNRHEWSVFSTRVNSIGNRYMRERYYHGFSRRVKVAAIIRAGNRAEAERVVARGHDLYGLAPGSQPATRAESRAVRRGAFPAAQRKSHVARRYAGETGSAVPHCHLVRNYNRATHNNRARPRPRVIYPSHPESDHGPRIGMTTRGPGARSYFSLTHSVSLFVRLLPANPVSKTTRILHHPTAVAELRGEAAYRRCRVPRHR